MHSRHSTMSLPTLKTHSTAAHLLRIAIALVDFTSARALPSHADFTDLSTQTVEPRIPPMHR